MSETTGTLMWIGPRDTSETYRAFAFCQRHASQLALRDSVGDAVVRSADAVTHIIVSRNSRATVSQQHLKTLQQQYPLARHTVLVGSNAEGEGRTGDPWPGWQRLRWHAWNQVLPACFNTSVVTPSGGTGLTMVVAATRQHAAAVLDVLTEWSIPSLWVTPRSIARARCVNRVFWDDSAAPATTAASWRTRLQAVHQTDSTRHAWTINYPRAHQLQAAERGGIDVPLSKPFLRDPVLRFISSSMPSP